MGEIEKDISLKGVRLPNSIRQQLRQTRKKLTENKSPPILKKKIKPIGLKQIQSSSTTDTKTPKINSKPGILNKGQKKNKTFKRVRFAVGADAQNDKETPINEGVFTEPPRLRLKNKSSRASNNIGKKGIKSNTNTNTNSTRKTFKIRIINSPSETQHQHPEVEDNIDLNIENIDEIGNGNIDNHAGIGGIDNDDNNSNNNIDKSNNSSVGESPILKDKGHIYALKGTPDGLIKNLTTLTEDVEIYKN
jgi:hypothetical protein